MYAYDDGPVFVGVHGRNLVHDDPRLPYGRFPLECLYHALDTRPKFFVDIRAAFALEEAQVDLDRTFVVDLVFANHPFDVGFQILLVLLQCSSVSLLFYRFHPYLYLYQSLREILSGCKRNRPSCFPRSATSLYVGSSAA